jgi:hypothetical protein
MARIIRVLQKIFALSNDESQRFGNGQFGSGQLGTKNITNDIEELQALPAFSVGWQYAVETNSAGQPSLPPLPEMQALNYICTYQIAYLFQEGIPEYDVDTTYYQNSIIKFAGTYELYGSNTNSNTGKIPGSDPEWNYLLNLAAAAETNTTLSIDGEMVLFSGTGGRTLKRATTTGLLKATSGVVSSATSGTDYAPATSGAAILKGNGAGGFSAASAGTDYVAPSSGQIIKAWVNFNGTGTIAINDSLNVSSLTDNGTGDYTVNLSITMGNANYSVTGGGRRAIGAIHDGDFQCWPVNTTSIRVTTSESGNAAVDWDIVCANIIGDYP